MEIPSVIPALFLIMPDIQGGNCLSPCLCEPFSDLSENFLWWPVQALNLSGERTWRRPSPRYRGSSQPCPGTVHSPDAILCSGTFRIIPAHCFPRRFRILLVPENVYCKSLGRYFNLCLQCATKRETPEGDPLWVPITRQPGPFQSWIPGSAGIPADTVRVNSRTISRSPALYRTVTPTTCLPFGTGPWLIHMLFVSPGSRWGSTM